MTIKDLEDIGIKAKLSEEVDKKANMLWGWICYIAGMIIVSLVTISLKWDIGQAVALNVGILLIAKGANDK